MSNSNINFKSDSYRGAEAVTPSDATEVAYSGFYVGSVGNVAIVTPAGDTVTFVAVPTGVLIPACAVKVLSTGTTASSIVGLK